MEASPWGVGMAEHLSGVAPGQSFWRPRSYWSWQSSAERQNLSSLSHRGLCTVVAELPLLSGLQFPPL